MNESFDWSYPGLDWSRFHAVANLLSLRNGGQAERSSSSGVAFVEDWESDASEDEYASSIGTNFAHRLSSSEHGKLKRKFLDCLAEFAANKKGGTAVACSIMEEAEDNAVVWIARNEGFSDMDQPVFDRMGNLLSSLFIDDADQFETSVWEEMISYHRSRIEQDYIPGLRASFKAYEAAGTRNDTRTPTSSSASDEILAILRTLLFDRNLDGAGFLEKHTRLAIASYDLRQSKDAKELLYSSPSANSKSKNLWFNICSLARLRAAWQVFKDIALTLPSFERVSITLVLRPVAPANPSQCPLNLNQTFGILNLDLGPTTTKAVLGHNWTVDKVKREFAKRQKQKPNVHAEVQMLMFLNTRESSTFKPFPYFGCSKLSCFMCNHFIRSYGRFTTRGCHGRLFRPWTVPIANQLLPGRADRISKALLLVQKEVQKQLKSSVDVHLRHERTSVVEGNSISSLRQGQRSKRQLQVDRLRMKAERDRVAEMFRRRTDEASGSFMHTNPIPEAGELEHDCHVCMRPTTRRCSLCNKDFFCSDACQQKSFGSHLFTCSKRPLTSADYLWKSLAEDLMPPDEDVLEDFGFNALIGRDMTYLLGVYRGLYLSGSVSAEDIHEWRVAGVLIDKIKEFYLRIPERSRGQYFPWFLKNSHVLERPMTKDEAQHKLMASFYDHAKPYLNVEDRDKTARNLKPEAKGECYNLLAEVLVRLSPNPIEKNWYSFGFVTCRGQGEESTLVDLYQLLLTESDGTLFYECHNRQRGIVPPATFTQFWTSYEAGTLIQLMDSKGLREVRSRLPFLKEFLSSPATGPRPTVWDLKQFLAIQDPIDYPPIPSISTDYGFINCRTFEETCTLMEIYDTVLKSADPMELHKACLVGDLFQFSSKFVRMEERWRSLMRNYYGLETVVGSELEHELRPDVGWELGADLTGLPLFLSSLLGLE